MVSALSVAQIVVFVCGALIPFLVKGFVPPGGLHDAIIEIAIPLQGLLLVLFRKPSTLGGTVAVAPLIEPDGHVIGTNATVKK